MQKTAAEIAFENAYWSTLAQAQQAPVKSAAQQAFEDAYQQEMFKQASIYENEQAMNLFDAAFNEHTMKLASLDPQYAAILDGQMRKQAFNEAYMATIKAAESQQLPDIVDHPYQAAAGAEMGAGFLGSIGGGLAGALVGMPSQGGHIGNTAAMLAVRHHYEQKHREALKGMPNEGKDLPWSMQHPYAMQTLVQSPALLGGVPLGSMGALTPLLHGGAVAAHAISKGDMPEQYKR